jgi:hypothetical protein
MGLRVHHHLSFPSYSSGCPSDRSHDRLSDARTTGVQSGIRNNKEARQHADAEALIQEQPGKNSENSIIESGRVNADPQRPPQRSRSSK